MFYFFNHLIKSLDLLYFNFAQVSGGQVGEGRSLFAALRHREATVEGDQKEGDRKQRYEGRDYDRGERLVWLADLIAAQFQF